MQFTINPPGFENPSIREELSLNQFIQLSFVKCFSSFWEVTDRSMARKVTLFLKWKCIIWKGSKRTSLLTGVPNIFGQGRRHNAARPRRTPLLMGGRAVRCQGCEGRMTRKSFQHSGFLPVLCPALLKS